MNRRIRLNTLLIVMKTGLSVLFSVLFISVQAQVKNISGVLNNVYSGIDSIYSKINTDPDTIFIKSTLGFAVNDTVLVMQTAGSRVDKTTGLEGYVADLRNTGRYGIFIIKAVDPGQKMIVLNTSLRNYLKLAKGELGQIVRIPTFKRVNVSGTLTCDPYNPVTGVGGVLVMLVEQSLTLNANIDVSGKGFPGADPGMDEYGGPCTQIDSTRYDKLFYNILSSDSSARKGFGLFDTTFMDLRGRCFATNAGGGGNGLFAGGGGGGHYSTGGQGGNESSSCSPPRATGGSGGKDMTTFLTSTKIYMGGGGGTGTQKPSISRLASKGGAGGGIIIIVSDTIIGNGNKIMSQGESVTGLSTAGAGGGGAGGSIYLHAFKYNASASTLTIDVKGGNGGDVSTVPGDPCGPGGGGSGGVIWYNESSITGPVTFITAGGISGKYNFQPYGAGNGGTAIPKNNLLIQIRGFLFNKLPDDQTICQDETPLPINAPKAAGGTGGPYNYLWEQSNDNINWSGAAGVKTNPGYIPGVLTDTTYYRRIVDDGILPKDTSKVLTIFVHPRINNNLIDPDTTVCSGLTAGSIYAPVPVTGGLGSGSYVYKWEESANNVLWTNAAGTNTTASYVTPVLTDTIYYRRIVTSGACENTSNSVKISVLEALGGNTIASDQIICNNQVPAGLTGGTITGGEPGDRTYKWQANSSGSWNDVGSSTGYNPSALTDTTRYRRIVYSGMNNTCTSTSNLVTITVLPDISNNFIINAADSVFCAGLISDSLLLKGTQPTGGDSPDYIYTWQERPASGSTWSDAEITNTLKTYNAGVLYDTTYFRRLVFSGANNVCKDTSSVILMKVLPEIGNNTITAPQTICALEVPSGLVGSFITGGSGTTPSYIWQKSPTPAEQASWQNATGSYTGRNYAPPALSSTLFFRRVVLSGPAQGTCKDTSATLQILVHNDITNNSINNPSPVFTCYNSEPDLLIGTTKASGGLAGGDETNYSFTWLESLNGTVWNLASQTRTNPDYQAEAITIPRYYRRYVSSGACEDTSAMVKVDTTHLPVLVSLAPQSGIVCYSSSDPHSQLNITINEGYAPYIIDYSNGQSGTGTANLPARTGSFKPSIIDPPGDSMLYTYTIDKITDKNGCEATEANLSAFSVPVRVYSMPDPVFSDKFIEVCDSVLTISPVPSFGTPQWEFVAGMSSNMYTPVNLNDHDIDLKANFNLNSDFSSEAWLVYRETIANCTSNDSVHAIFYKTPEKVQNVYRASGNELIPVGDTLIVFISDNQDLRADAVSLGIPTWTVTSGPAQFSNTEGINTSLTGLDLKTPSIFEYSIVNGVCTPDVKTVKVLRKDFIIFDGFSPNDDNVNDVLYAKGLYDEEIRFRIQIFSSAGRFVREISRDDLSDFDFEKNEVVIWDGTTKIGGADDKVPDGTYYYVLTVSYKGQKFDKKGYIIVKR